MRQSQVLLIIILLLQGCKLSIPNENNSFSLTEQDKDWLMTDSMTLFYSNTGNVDTMKMIEMDIHGPIQAYSHYALYHNNQKILLTQLIQRMDSNRIDFCLYSYSIISDTNDIQVYNRELKLQTIDISGKLFEVLIINDWDTDSLFYYSKTSKDNLDKVTFVKNIGMLSYRLENGEEFKRELKNYSDGISNLMDSISDYNK